MYLDTFKKNIHNLKKKTDPLNFVYDFPFNPPVEAWEAWLRRQGLSRLLRHDSRRFLRMDGLNLRAARAETCDFRVKGMADGQVELDGWSWMKW